MPYEWIPAQADQPERLHLWPYRSLTRQGFVWFMGATCLLIALPVLTMIGSAILWVLLGFFALTFCGMWWAINRSWRDGEILEDLTFTADHLSLTRHGPRGQRQEWQANAYWVRVTLHPTGGPVPHYLTLSGEGRTVELGAFLSEAERIALAGEVRQKLAVLR